MGQPVFIVGCSRSGTTLLSVMLDRHSDLAITPETAFYDEVAPGLSTTGADLGRVLSGWRRLPELGLDVDEVVKRCGRRPTSRALLDTLLGMYAEARAKPRSGEKTPQHLNHVSRMIEDFPDSRVVCLVRDGRDVALSLRLMPWGPADLRRAAEAWLKAIELSDAFTVRYPCHFKTVCYEHLVARPVEMMSEVMTFLGLDLQTAQLEPGASDVVLARSMAWKGMALQAIDASRVGRWLSMASAEEIDYLHRALGPTLTRLGYQV
jgi:Sulfotransferase family